jgi:predicted nucleic acid-binding Zn ribbon protein
MPLALHECSKCGTISEELYSSQATVLDCTICSLCGGLADRIYGKPGLRFIGSGFYVNDYKDKKE